jgi:hypothetical protein
VALLERFLEREAEQLTGKEQPANAVHAGDARKPRRGESE